MKLCRMSRLRPKASRQLLDYLILQFRTGLFAITVRPSDESKNCRGGAVGSAVIVGFNKRANVAGDSAGQPVRPPERTIINRDRLRLCRHPCRCSAHRGGKTIVELRHPVDRTYSHTHGRCDHNTACSQARAGRTACGNLHCVAAPGNCRNLRAGSDGALRQFRAQPVDNRFRAANDSANPVLPRYHAPGCQRLPVIVEDTGAVSELGEGFQAETIEPFRDDRLKFGPDPGGPEIGKMASGDRLGQGTDSSANLFGGFQDDHAKPGFRQQ